MKHKKILLIEENYNDILAVQDALKKLGGEHTLHVVHNIRDALQVLMGGSSPARLENYTQTGKVRPDIVLLNINFLQESAHEFLDVINKYYTLKSIRVFIIGDSVQQIDPELAARYGIAGYLAKPIDLQDTLNESVVTLRQELLKPGKALLALPLFGLQNKFFSFLKFIKVNAASVFGGQTVVTKVAVSAIATVCVAGAVTVSPSSDLAENHSHISAGTVSAAPRSPVAPVVEVCTEHEALVASESITLPDVRMELPAPEKEPEVRTVAEPQPETATRTFSIVAVEEPEDYQVAAQ